MIITLISVGLLMNAAWTSQEADIYGETKGWVVLKDTSDDTCGAIRSYTNSSSLSFILYPRKDSVRIMVSSSHFKAIEGGKTYKLDLYFVQRGKLDDGWGEVDAIGVRSESGKNMVTFTLKSEQALKDVAASETIAIFHKDKVAGSFELDGSANMIAMLKKCGAEIVKANPIDPFED